MAVPMIDASRCSHPAPAGKPPLRHAARWRSVPVAMASTLLNEYSRDPCMPPIAPRGRRGLLAKGGASCASPFAQSRRQVIGASPSVHSTDRASALTVRG
jgi:hypothetical protein